MSATQLKGGKDSKRFSARRENLVLQNASLSPQDYESPGNFRTNRDDGSISERLPESLATRLRSGEFGSSQPFDLLAIAVSCSSHASAAGSVLLASMRNDFLAVRTNLVCVPPRGSGQASLAKAEQAHAQKYVLEGVSQRI
jgi:hypothetical protein